ncbi:hypothetical protein GCM10009718_35370 [Isoptericola halotolerans]|uniref:Uncharacterized protein n=1 Tax=Isoptericola halotolerans TaxID=300560 RepID=A0ABX2A6F4_9MICO|nr:permease prefix domain 1-containing protein [Isoptericola halotolerans]NOV97183.1 hypothetical protein [Isoptericola halotolerans]
MTAVHRLLDDAFAGVELTAEVQDLKEEIRTNLVARAAEIEAAGTAPSEAARRAVDELGELHAVIADAAGTMEPDAPTGSRSSPVAYTSTAQAVLANRVRPRPAFVVSLVIAAAGTAALLVLIVLGLSGVLAAPVGGLAGWVLGAGLGTGWIVGSSLAQETTTRHPAPAPRAAGYGLAAGLVVVGLGFVGVAVTSGQLWLTVLAAPSVVAGAALFAGLGATQTNRRKAWFREVVSAHGTVGDRFDRDPQAAARFGILTVVIWVAAFVAFVVGGSTLGWAWAWLALVVGWIGFMLLLVRMLFGGHER